MPLLALEQQLRGCMISSKYVTSLVLFFSPACSYSNAIIGLNSQIETIGNVHLKNDKYSWDQQFMKDLILCLIRSDMLIVNDYVSNVVATKTCYSSLMLYSLVQMNQDKGAFHLRLSNHNKELCWIHHL